MQDVYRMLESLRQLEYGWDAQDAVPPGDHTIDHARSILDTLHRHACPPYRVTASADSTVRIVFIDTIYKYADFELWADGALVGCTHDRTRTGGAGIDVWAIGAQEMLTAIKRIKEFVREDTYDPV